MIRTRLFVTLFVSLSSVLSITVFGDVLAKEGTHAPHREGTDLRVMKDKVHASASQTWFRHFGVSHRLLKEASSCAWNSADATCVVSNEAQLEFLAEMDDDSLARYLYRRLFCASLTPSRATCEKESCRWSGLTCTITSQDLQYLHNDSCVNPALPFFEPDTLSSKCANIDSVVDCDNDQDCYWGGALEGCLFDRWMYHFGIETKDGYPIGYKELFAMREDQVIHFLQERYEKSNAKHPQNGILDMTLPKMTCPDAYNDLVCEYVEAMSERLRVWYYCSTTHGGSSACMDDFHCTVETISRDSQYCVDSKDQHDLAALKAEQVFNRAIPDSEARRLAEATTTCHAPSDSFECTGYKYCHWSTESNRCLLSEAWKRDNINRLIGSSKERVCRFIVLDTESGCSAHREEGHCYRDKECSWSEDDHYCHVGSDTEVEYVLKNSEAEAEYKILKHDCQAKETPAVCHEFSHTTTKYVKAIEANKTSEHRTTPKSPTLTEEDIKSPVEIQSPKKEEEEVTEQGSQSKDQAEQTAVISFTVGGVVFLIIVACVGYALEQDSEMKARLKDKIQKRSARSSKPFSF